MRARLIKPGYFKSDELAALSMAARILFSGLWCLADRAGRLEDRPLRIKAEVLPYDSVDVDALLTDLHSAGFILRYSDGAHRFIQVEGFARHQTPHVREPESTIPPPAKHNASTVQAPDEHQSGPAVPTYTVPTIPEADTEAVAENGNGRVTAPPRAIRDPLKRREPEEIAKFEPIMFGRLWRYWGKVGDVAEAAKAWDACRPTSDLMQAMRTAIDRQREAFGWGQPGGQAQPHLGTWIRKERWHMEAVPNKVEAL